MIYLVVILLILALVFGPQLWASYTFKRYAAPREDIPGNGGELARHLLDRFDMPHVKVEKAGEGEDHYDPTDKAVRLSPSYFEQNSLTAVAVAAHEVGHAIQHHREEPLLALRSRLAVIAMLVQKVGAAAVVGIPIVAAVTRMPMSGAALFLVGIASMGTAVVLHLVTLPVEVDASFGKALPILRQGYIKPGDEAAVKRILRAAAFTYLAASLASLLNLWRWIAILRR